MSKPLGPVEIRRRKASDQFKHFQQPAGFTLQEFFEWSSSDLANTPIRGVLAEFLVAKALDAPSSVRVVWDSVDIRLPNGFNVEVKSAAYSQSWPQKTGYSNIIFGIKKTHYWDPLTNTFAETKARHAHVYVFCLLAHRDKPTLDPTDLCQWIFYVLPTHVIESRIDSQSTVSLRALHEMRAMEVTFQELKAAVLQTCESIPLATAQGSQENSPPPNSD